MTKPDIVDRNTAGRPRIPELDVPRGIAIAAVVGLHASWVFVMRAPMDTVVGHLIAELHMLTGFGVPLFVALSAAGLTLRYGEPNGWGAAQLRLLARRARRLLPAYVLWSIISTLNRPALLWPPGRLLRLLTDGTADLQFYFIPLIFEMYLLWPLFQHLVAWLRRASSPTSRLARSVLLVILSAVFSFAWWVTSGHHPMLRKPPGLLGFWFLYAVLGLVASVQLDRLLGYLRSHRPLILALAVVTVLGGAAWMWTDFTTSIHPPFSHSERAIAVMVFRISHAAYTYAASVFLLAWACGRHRHFARSLLNTLGKHSYGIYLVHLVVLHQVRTRVLHDPLPGDFATFSCLLDLFVLWAMTLILTFGFTWTAARSRWTAWTVG